MSLLERLADLKTCTYCGKLLKKQTMKHLKNDDNPQLNCAPIFRHVFKDWAVFYEELFR